MAFAMKRGSLTVEAAAVMSIVLLVVMGALYLCFFVHNRAWLTAAAYESALSGSMENMKNDGKVYENALAKSKALGNTGFFGAENLSVQVQTGKNVSVTYQLDTISTFGDFQWHLQAQGSSKIIDPVDWIRKAKAAAETFDITGG